MNRQTHYHLQLKSIPYSHWFMFNIYNSLRLLLRQTTVIANNHLEWHGVAQSNRLRVLLWTRQQSFKKWGWLGWLLCCCFFLSVSSFGLWRKLLFCAFLSFMCHAESVWARAVLSFVQEGGIKFLIHIWRAHGSDLCKKGCPVSPLIQTKCHLNF